MENVPYDFLPPFYRKYRSMKKYIAVAMGDDTIVQFCPAVVIDTGIGEGMGRNRPWALLGAHPTIRLERFRKTMEGRNQDGRTGNRAWVVQNASPSSKQPTLYRRACGGVPEGLADSFHSSQLLRSRGTVICFVLLSRSSQRIIVPALRLGFTSKPVRAVAFHLVCLALPFTYPRHLHVVRLLASHLGEPGSIPGGVAPGFSDVGIVPLVGGFSQASLVCPALAFLRCSILTSLRPFRLPRPRR
ncbi:hypothetical protein PR048_017297 [Dryococelus australis]|uniref:Uncharacterized protein n=1 Tax=Dryococelus australis TaxID=614101 RepID=A0ABQ9H9A1_9NEOP|nr:hypothetical protein PR048_017297 [Dryococelus australis]